jgi:hypothetical protein
MMNEKMLIYISCSLGNMSPTDIDELAERAANKNQILGITGVLAKVGNHFMQILEGPIDAVDGLMAEIRQDARHYDLHVVYQAPIETHTFDRWCMAATDLDANFDFPLNAYSTLREQVCEIIETEGKGKFPMMEVIAGFRALLCKHKLKPGAQPIEA